MEPVLQGGLSARNPRQDWKSGLLPPKHKTAGLGLVLAFFVLGFFPGLVRGWATASLPTERLLPAARVFAR